MMQFITTIATILEQQRDETDDERADRLAWRASEAGVDPVTLHRFEEEVGDLCEAMVEDSDSDPNDDLAEIASLLASRGLGMEVDGEQALALAGIDWSTVRPVLIQSATANAAALAPIIKVLDETYRASGLYRDLGLGGEQDLDPSQKVSIINEASERATTPAVVDDIEAELSVSDLELGE